MIQVWVFLCILTSIAFLSHGLYLAPRIQLSSGWTRITIRILATTFFLSTASSQILLAFNADNLPAVLTGSWYGFLALILQSVSGVPYFLLSRYFSTAVVVEIAPRKRITWSDLEVRWRLVRDVVLFFSGLTGMAYCTLTRVNDPVIISAFAAMCGLPVFIRGEERKREADAPKG